MLKMTHNISGEPHTVSVQLDDSTDATGLDDYLYAFVVLLQGIGFPSDVIDRALSEEYCLEALLDRYVSKYPVEK